MFARFSFYVIVAHWFACVWYVIGREDLKNGLMHGWLPALANKTGNRIWNNPLACCHQVT